MKISNIFKKVISPGVKAKKPPGQIVVTRHSALKDQLFYVNEGSRRYIRNNNFFIDNGYNLTNDLIEVHSDVLKAFVNRGPVPIYKIDDLKNIKPTFFDMRDAIASNLVGTGVEFGAGSSPFPVPLGCRVFFADAFDYEILLRSLYPGQNRHDLIKPDYVTDINNFSGIANSSLDFIIACHVIEHTNNPIKSIENSYNALKPGGFLVLVVPDMLKTFDKDRELTTLEHLIEDYDYPSDQRDLKHYVEFYKKAFYDHVPKDADLDKFALKKMREHGDLHYHTWTYKSFGELMNYCCKKIGFSIVFSHPTLPGSDNIEFYYLLKK